MIVETLFVVAAGSGGHMLPAATIAKAWHQLHPAGQVLFMTGPSPLEQRIVNEQPHVTKTATITLTKASLRQWYLLPLLTCQLIGAFIKSTCLLLHHKPTRVITTGGIHALPVCYAAWLMRYPIDVYELNVIPGKAVRALLPIASKIYYVFSDTRQHIPERYHTNSTLVTYPLRFTSQDIIINRNTLVTSINNLIDHQAPDGLHFSPERKTLFILGGSQGSQLLNKLTKQFLLEHQDQLTTLQIIHQTGPFEEEVWRQFYHDHQLPALTFSYSQEISACYQLADLILCRAGAGTLFEIAFFNKRCIVIPLVASTTDHQVDNAHALARMHPDLVTVIEQDTATNNPTGLFANITSCLFSQHIV